MEIDKSKVKPQLDYDKKFENCGFSTRAIHVGNEPDGVHGGLAVPINLSTTFAQTSPSDPIGTFDYSRCGNPTRFALERCIASIEGGKYGLVFTSGMSATMTIIHLLKPGDHVVSIDDVYGGTQRYFRRVSNPQQGVEFSFVDFDDLENVKKSIRKETKLVWVESLTNPLLKVTDVRNLVKVVKEINKDIIIVVDNTFLSPYNSRPLELGADIVVESATKYLGGHSDVLGGVIALNDDELREKLYFIHKNLGATLSPFDSYNVLKGIKTLSLRIRQSNENALNIAKYLEKSQYVEKVLYPGLESSKYYDLVKSQSKGAGAIVSFYIKGGYEEATVFLKNLKIFILAESLGAVESLAESPALMTHASVPADLRKELGIADNFIRLAVGIEEYDDLVNDLENALVKASGVKNK